jgi:hypothetical protein
MKILSITGQVLFTSRKNSLKEVLEDANLECANLEGANLEDANLQCANLWDANLRGANLWGANLEDANLRGANLWGANLEGAILRGANLWGANLKGANLRDANLQCAILQGAILRGANLECANLQCANLEGANLQCAILQCANLEGANLRGANISAFYIIPQTGSFIAWKKCNNFIVKLEIPAEAKRVCSLVGRKCRAEFVKVIEIINIDDNSNAVACYSNYDSSFIYELDKIIKPDSFDDDIRIECSYGIHFFITREEAEKY